MMKGGGCNKRDRRFLTIEILSSKTEYCSDNIIEMTSSVGTALPKYGWTIRYDTGPRAERGGWGLVRQSILLNKDKEKAFNSCCIVTRTCLTSHN